MPPSQFFRAAAVAVAAAGLLPPVAGAVGPAELFRPAGPPWFGGGGCDGGGCDGACDLTAPHAGRGPGTLFLWPGNEPGDGGPDLGAPLVTDRPDFTEASSTVGAGVAQLEFGYTYTTDSGDAVRSHSIGEPLLRLGAGADWLELRVAWNYAAERSGAGPDRDTADGGEDLYLGLKLALTPQDRWLPETALIPQMIVPTGADAFTAGTVLPGANLVYSWDLTDRLATGGSTQVNRVLSGLAPVPVPGTGVNPGAGPAGDGETFTELAQSWTVAASVTDRVGAYGEYFGFYPLDESGADDEHFLNGGLTYLLADDIQYDVRAGFGLNDAADDFFAGTGLSVRFR